MTEEQEFKDFINPIRKQLFSKALKLTGNKHDADDLFQETQIKIWNNLHKFKKGTNAVGWACTVMCRKHIDIYRKKKKKNSIFCENINGEHVTYNKGLTTINQQYANYKLSVLPIKQKDCIKHQMDGYTYEEISRKLEIPIGTVRRCLFRGKSKLRDDYNKGEWF